MNLPRTLPEIFVIIKHLFLQNRFIRAGTSARIMARIIAMMMCSVYFILFFGITNTHAQPLPEEDISRFLKGVMRIHVASQPPDYVMPWNAGGVVTGYGTGFLISGNRILTNAHVCSNARFVAVEKEGDPKKYEARVKFIAHDCDLAILDVADPEFFKDMIPVEFGGIPSLNSTVRALGYPIGGERLSVTRGVVSRIDFRIYSHSNADSHLTIQIDAAINSGNSGGPVIQNGKAVGVAFQGYSGNVAQNVGYMIPVPVIQRFLTDVKDGQYDHYVDLGIMMFPLLNRAHRRALGLDSDDFGVLVSQVMTAGAAFGILQEGDVLLSIDGLPIFSSGDVDMDGDRVQMAEVVERKFKGDTVSLQILRDGRKQSVTIAPNLPWPYLIQSRRYDALPRFVMFGGLVFQPMSTNFVNALNIRDYKLLYHYTSFLEKEFYIEQPEIIVLSKILQDPINAYLNVFTNCIVEEINGMKIRTLEDVSAALKKEADYYVIHMTGKGRPVVLEHGAVMAAKDRIMEKYGVLKEEYLGNSIVPEHIIHPSTTEN